MRDKDQITNKSKNNNSQEIKIQDRSSLSKPKPQKFSKTKSFIHLVSDKLDQLAGIESNNSSNIKKFLNKDLSDVFIEHTNLKDKFNQSINIKSNNHIEFNQYDDKNNENNSKSNNSLKFLRNIDKIKSLSNSKIKNFMNTDFKIKKKENKNIINNKSVITKDNSNQTSKSKVNEDKSNDNVIDVNGNKDKTINKNNKGNNNRNKNDFNRLINKINNNSSKNSSSKNIESKHIKSKNIVFKDSNQDNNKIVIDKLDIENSDKPIFNINTFKKSIDSNKKHDFIKENSVKLNISNNNNNNNNHNYNNLNNENVSVNNNLKSNENDFGYDKHHNVDNLKDFHRFSFSKSKNDFNNYNGDKLAKFPVKEISDNHIDNTKFNTTDIDDNSDNIINKNDFKVDLINNRLNSLDNSDNKDNSLNKLDKDYINNFNNIKSNNKNNNNFNNKNNDHDNQINNLNCNINNNKSSNIFSKLKFNSKDSSDSKKSIIPKDETKTKVGLGIFGLVVVVMIFIGYFLLIYSPSQDELNKAKAIKFNELNSLYKGPLAINKEVSALKSQIENAKSQEEVGIIDIIRPATQSWRKYQLIELNRVYDNFSRVMVLYSSNENKSIIMPFNEASLLINSSDAKVLSNLEFKKPDTVIVPLTISRTQAGAGLISEGNLVDIYFLNSNGSNAYYQTNISGSDSNSIDSNDNLNNSSTLTTDMSNNSLSPNSPQNKYPLISGATVVAIMRSKDSGAIEANYIKSNTNEDSHLMFLFLFYFIDFFFIFCVFM
ncbi:hypothetical protein [Methanobrevibacter filiformis]|uniref:Uncharacterized protein n=1 Tax=Methanobrevibacter filiformis TaxID=55758 RepID=A0A166FBE5_9EURY|nr:hypothetical protein [Methanobrevibacter filiformis]KZX17496.1 hypothetical protein MBFIL_01070 [Methanobrevibacter filiformis]